MLHVLPRMLRALVGRGEVWLAGGGSSAVGTLGWVSGAHEILAQLRQGVVPRFDSIYVALGSCGTVAGLLVGLRGAGAPSIVAVRVVHETLCGERRTRRLAAATVELLRPLGLKDSAEPRLTLEGRFLGAGYGHPTPESRDAVRIAGEHGLDLEPIYTGKVMAALLGHAREGRLAGKRVLFVHSSSHDAWRSAPVREEAT
jgi:D-cysteine desulfhydrase